MSHLRVCLLALVILGAANAAEDKCKMKLIPGSEHPVLSSLESNLRSMKETKDNWWSKLWGSSKAETAINLDEVEIDPQSYIIPPGRMSGLKWCGDGDVAKNFDDLGYFSTTDACCRAHDKCEFNILAGEEKKNLKNSGIFTKSACKCDFEFFECMSNATKVVNMVERTVCKRIANMYFNRVRPQCFQCICPSAGCKTDADDNKCMDHCDKFEWIDNSKW